MDRFVAASSQESVSRIEVLGDLFRKGSGSCALLERVFTPKEVQDRQWVLTEEATRSTSAEVIKPVQSGPEAGAASGDPTSSKGSNKGMQKPSMLTSALADEEQGPGPVSPPMRGENSKGMKAVRISDAGIKREPTDQQDASADAALPTSPSQARVRAQSMSSSLMSGPVNMMNRLKQPASSVQMSTRSFAAQLADMDRSILQMLTQVEDKHAATLGFWRSKATMLAERIDSMESSLRALEDQLIDGDSDHTPLPSPATSTPVPAGNRAASQGVTRDRLTTISVRSARLASGLDTESMAQMESLRLDTDALDKRLDIIEDMLNLQQMAFVAGGGKKGS